jgi:hypothetical protein
VGIKPVPERLCTNAARSHNILEAAYRRSLGFKAIPQVSI